MTATIPLGPPGASARDGSRPGITIEERGAVLRIEVHRAALHPERLALLGGAWAAVPGAVVPVRATGIALAEEITATVRGIRARPYLYGVMVDLAGVRSVRSTPAWMALEALLAARCTGRTQPLVDAAARARTAPAGSADLFASEERWDDRWFERLGTWTPFLGPFAAGERRMRTRSEVWLLAHTTPDRVVRDVIERSTAAWGGRWHHEMAFPLRETAQLARARAAIGSLVQRGWIDPASVSVRPRTVRPSLMQPDAVILRWTPLPPLTSVVKADLFVAW